MTTANWITLLIAILGVAGTWGALLVRVKMVEGKASKTADDVALSRERQGQRIGAVEERCAALEGASYQRARTRTRGGGTAIIDDELDGR